MSRAEERRPTNARLSSLVFRPSSIVVLLCLPALVPMLFVTFWTSHDGLHHIFRLANFDEGVRSGVLFPRWADGLGFGYGFPVTHYYAPLAYYLAELFHLLGEGVLDSLKWTYALMFVGAALAIYRLARDVLGSRAALLAAAAYAYYPYHIADLYMRGTLTEFAALALLPLIVWSARRVLLRVSPRASLITYALSLAALILTHNLTAFLFLPALALYLLLNRMLDVKRRLPDLARATWDLGLGTALAFALAAFYLLPALGEVAWIRAGQVGGSVDDLATLLTPITRFVAVAPLQPYLSDAPASLQHPLGLVVALLSAFVLVAAIALRKQFDAARRAEGLAWLTLALVASVAMLDWSAPLWANVRALAFVQFPYRLHAILGLSLAMLIGLGAQAVEEHYASRVTHHVLRVAYSVLIAALMVASLGALSLTPQSLPGHKEPISEAQVNRVGMSEYDYQTALWARLYGSPWLLEYLPAWVTEAREEFFLPHPQPLPRFTGEGSGARITVQQYRPQARVLRVQSTQPFQLSFHTFYFPSWQMRVDGALSPTFPSGPLALVGAEVPAGDHTVTLTLEATAWQRAGEIISLLAVTIVLALILVLARHKLVWLAVSALLVVGALGWGTLRADDAPHAVAATLDNQIDLLGYQTARELYQPGDVVDLTLYWFARQTPAEDYKVFIHVDGNGGRAGQLDAQPGLNFSPTTRWQRGEVIADHYRVRLSASAAPGVYELFTGMYRTQPVTNLPVVSDAAVPGDRVRLGTLTITRP